MKRRDILSISAQTAAALTVPVAAAEPETVLVDTHGTGMVPEAHIERGIRDVFPLTPDGIYDDLHLGRPIYRKAAQLGYFGRADPDFTWERLDRVDQLRKAV